MRCVGCDKWLGPYGECDCGLTCKHDWELDVISREERCRKCGAVYKGKAMTSLHPPDTVIVDDPAAPVTEAERAKLKEAWERMMSERAPISVEPSPATSEKERESFAKRFMKRFAKEAKKRDLQGWAFSGSACTLDPNRKRM